MPDNLPVKHHQSDEATLRKLKKYLLLRSEGQMFYEACRNVGISPRTVQDWRSKNAQFAESERLSVREGVEPAEIVLKNKAMNGDMQALPKYLEAHAPETYGPKSTIRHEHVHELGVNAANAIDKIRNLREELERRQRDTPGTVIGENPFYREDQPVDADDDEVVEAEIVE